MLATLDDDYSSGKSYLLGGVATALRYISWRFFFVFCSFVPKLFWLIRRILAPLFVHVIHSVSTRSDIQDSATRELCVPLSLVTLFVHFSFYFPTKSFDWGCYYCCFPLWQLSLCENSINPILPRVPVSSACRGRKRHPPSSIGTTDRDSESLCAKNNSWLMLTTKHMTSLVSAFTLIFC